MTQRGRHILVQILLVGLCFVSLLFSIFREQIIIRHVIQRYELPYLGTTLLRIIDEESPDSLGYTVRAFEDSNSVRAYVLNEEGRLLYPDSVTETDAEMIERARIKMFNLGYGPLSESAGKDSPVLWGVRDKRSGNSIFIAFSQIRMLDMYRQESRRLTTAFFSLFFLLSVGSFLVVRQVFYSSARDMESHREQLVLLQAVIEAQASLVRNAQLLMRRCSSGLRERDPLDPVAEDLSEYNVYLDNSQALLRKTLVPDANEENRKPVHLHSLCTRAQGLVADDCADAGVFITLSEVDAGLYVRGQENLMLLALEDLFHKLLPMVNRGERIGMTITGSGERASLDITVPAKERLFHPAGFFLSGFLFELIGISLSYVTDENMELLIHADFPGSGV